ncbi:MAG TPA: hypothetical protein VGF94_06100 [Kofleriaceae bacterium]|jgi:hypothetical protein
MLLGCQQYANLKQRYFPPDAPWTHVPAASGQLSDPLSGTCRIPQHVDDYYGFSIGYPAGWRIDYSSGALFVAKDDTQLVGAIVFPARLRRTGVPPEQLANGFAESLARTVRAGGGTFELVDKFTDGTTATATVVASVHGVAVRGPLQVIERPGFATLKLYWAPDNQLAAEEPMLKQVVTCFKRRTTITSRHPVAPAGGPRTRIGVAGGGGAAAQAPAAQPLREYHGRYFTIGLPAGWAVADETAHGIDVVATDHSAAFGFGFVIGTLLRPDVMVMQGIQQLYPGVQIAQSGFPPAPAGWQIAAAEFAGRQTNGIEIHGFSRAAKGEGVILTSIWTTTPAKWTPMQATLQAMAASVQIQPAAVAQVQAGIRRQLASYPPIRPSTPTSTSSASSSGGIGGWDDGQATHDRIQQGWSDSMLGQERTVSPSSGEEYVVPTNAWSETGPQGAGYYRAVPGGGAERLDVIDNSGNAQ